MINWPPSLILSLARRNSVLYLGSGVSANSIGTNGERPPIWAELLLGLAGRIQDVGNRMFIKQLIQNNELLLACELIIRSMNRTIFNEYIQEKLRRPHFTPAKIHELLYNLDSRIVLTPNVDKIYDQYVTNKSCGTVVIKNYYDDDVPSFICCQERMLLKVHGSLDAPTKMIFSKQDYTEAKYKYRNFYEILDALSITHTYIFIGCGIYDPDIQLTLENYNFNHPHNKPHFFIVAKDTIPPLLATSLKETRCIEFVEFENTDGTYQNLIQGLENLVSLVENCRSELKDTQNW